MRNGITASKASRGLCSYDLVAPRNLCAAADSHASESNREPEVQSKAVDVAWEQARAHSAYALRRLEEERKRIARELHDEARQALIAIQLGLRVLARQVPAELRPEVAQLSVPVSHSTKLLGNLVRRLRPPTLDRLGPHGALHTATRQRANLMQKLHVHNQMELMRAAIVRGLVVAAGREQAQMR